jgi:hypothetical protein
MGHLWTNQELRLLKECYPIFNKKELTALFPTRSYQAITRKASKLHIAKSKDFKKKLCTDTWSEDQYRILREYYSTTGAEKMCRLVPGKSYKQISIKAWNLGLRKLTIDSDISKKWWTPAEIKELKKHYASAEPEKLKKLFPDRAMSSISWKARSMGLARDCQKPWSNAELDYLKKNYVHESMEVILGHITRHSSSSVWSKASELGLNKYRAGEYYWTKENDIKLLELFNQGLTHKDSIINTTSMASSI